MGFWRQAKGRCQLCQRPVDRLYEVREGPVTGHFCSRLHYEMAVKEAGGEKLSKPEGDVSYW